MLRGLQDRASGGCAIEASLPADSFGEWGIAECRGATAVVHAWLAGSIALIADFTGTIRGLMALAYSIVEVLTHGSSK